MSCFKVYVNLKCLYSSKYCWYCNWIWIDDAMAVIFHIQSLSKNSKMLWMNLTSLVNVVLTFLLFKSSKPIFLLLSQSHCLWITLLSIYYSIIRNNLLSKDLKAKYCLRNYFITRSKESVNLPLNFGEMAIKRSGV